MDDLIYRENVIKVIEELNVISFYELNEHSKETFYEIREAIKNIPSATLKYGEWIEDYNNTYGRCRMKCSACGKFSGIGGIKSNQRKPFCPNCGARMR